MFRALTDIYYIYHSIEAMIDYISQNPYNLSTYARPGAFNDADAVSSRQTDRQTDNTDSSPSIH